MSVATGHDETLPLAAGFPSLTHAQWQELAAKVVNHGRPEDRHYDGPGAQEALRTHTVDGLAIDPLYQVEDEPQPIGHPGIMPFTRGTGLRSPAEPWDIRGYYDGTDARTTAEEILLELQRGVTSVWLEVGADAIAPDDVARVLDGVMLDLAPVVLSSRDDQRAAAAALLAVWDDRGPERSGAGGRLGHDPLAHVARHGGTVDNSAMIDHVRECFARRPKVRAITVDTRPYHDAGAGDVDELGCAVAAGIAHVRALEAAGISARDAFAQISFRVSAGADQFLTIARLRALRRLWARVGEVCGVPVELRGARQHAVSSRRMLTRDDPWVNILRGTVACFGAAVGGAEAITVLPFDTAWGRPDALARRIARNTQLLLAEESNVGRVVDPAGGSWYVEALTDQVAQAGWAWMQEIEAAGGMAQTLAEGRIADRLAATSAERARRLAVRTLPLTGVSMFPNPAEQPLVREPNAAATAPVADVPSEALRPHRDSEVFEGLRDRSAAFAKAHGGPPTVPLLCLGARRDFGARETFTSSFLGIAGIAAPIVQADSPEEFGRQLRESGAKVAFLCSSPKLYAAHGAHVAAAARAAGVHTLYLAGQARELGQHAGVVDGVVHVGSDVVAALRALLVALDVPETPQAQQALATAGSEGDQW